MKRLVAGLVFALMLAVSSAAEAAGFPVTIHHAFGDTTIPEQPKRVVSIGFVEQDFLYALGVAPVGVRDWFGGYPYATWPWADAARKAIGAAPEVLGPETLDLEWVLKQNPDLIIGTFVGLEQKDYDALSRIAPVVAWPAPYGAWSAPWQEQLRIIDQATAGDTVTSDKIIADIDGKIATVKAAYPQFAGKTGTVVYYSDGSFKGFGPEDISSRFLISLGLKFPPALEGKAGEGNQIDISAENFSMLDMDVAVWPINKGDADTQKSVEAMPLYQSSRLGKEGRSVWLDDGEGILTGAFTFQTPLAIEYLIDKLPPLLAEAVDGDPNTAVVVPKP